MKEIKILHLFPQLLSLYGEYANVLVLKHYLEKNSCIVHTDVFDDSLGSFEDYDLIFISSGTEENIVYALELLSPHRDKIYDSIENGTMWLCCGNALAVFGEKITDSRGNCHKGLNIFSFSSFEERKRFSGDVITKDKYSKPLIGYVNNSYRFIGITEPFSELFLNKQLGNDKVHSPEGLEYKNFIASTLTGPLLVKNPHCLEVFAEKLAGNKICIPENDNIKKAYNQTLSEMQSRLNNQK